jgi:hypothetical protein
MPLNHELLEELSDRFVLDLRHSESYRNLPEEERAQLDTRLAQEAVRGAYPLLPGATEEELDRLAEAMHSRLGIVLPGSLRATLQTVDGFIENGVVLFGTDHELRDDGFDSGPGIIEETENLWTTIPEAKERYLFLGDSDLWWFVFDLALQSYLVLSKSAFQPVYQFADAADLVNDMLRQALNDFDEEKPKPTRNYSLN